MTEKQDGHYVAERFYVENPEWVYGKRMVVLASDYNRLEALYHTQVMRNQRLQEKCDEWERAAHEWERAARIARERNSGRVTGVKTTPAHDERGLPISPTNLSGGPYKP